MSNIGNSLVVLLGSAMLMTASLTQAGPLPAPYELLQTQGPAGAGQIQNGPGSISIGGLSNRSASASLNLGLGTFPPDPTLTAKVRTYVGGSQPYAEATAELVYAAELLGPAGGSATVNISFTESVCCGYGVTEAVEGYDIREAPPGSVVSIDPSTGAYGIVPGYPSSYSVISNGGFGLRSSISSPIETGPSHLNTTLFGVPVGTIFLLALSVDAKVDPSVPACCGFPPPTSLTASIDPTVKVVGTTGNASEYSLIYSPEIQPVPEPSSLVTLFAGIPLLAFAGRRMARKAGAAS